jgi:hypothetical protein
MVLFCILITLTLALLVSASNVRVLNTTVVDITAFTKLKSSGKSTLYRITVPPLPKGVAYDTPPYLLELHGSRHQIGYDYAALLHDEANYTISTFLESVFPAQDDRLLLTGFFEYCWSAFLEPATRRTAPEFLEELAGMDAWFAQHAPAYAGHTTADVSRMFYTLANMPADPQNIVAMLEQELEKGWPWWLKDAVNDLIKVQCFFVFFFCNFFCFFFCIFCLSFFGKHNKINKIHSCSKNWYTLVMRTAYGVNVRPVESCFRLAISTSTATLASIVTNC